MYTFFLLNLYKGHLACGEFGRASPDRPAFN